MFMSAFAKENFFGDPALQESLMACFMERINEAHGTDTVTILTAHATWFQHMVKEVLLKKKQPKRVYRVFAKYSDQVLLVVLKHLIERVDDINLQGTIMILVNGRLWSHKRRDNLRMMKDFAIRAINALKRERESLGD